jgi:hypothetical protein
LAFKILDPIEVPRIYIYKTLIDKIFLFEKIKNQTPNASHRQLTEIATVLRSAIAGVLLEQAKLLGERT